MATTPSFQASHAGATDALCQRIARAIACAARDRDPHVYLDCGVFMADRVVLVGGELGFWPPMGHFESIVAQVPRLVRDVLTQGHAPLDLPLPAVPAAFEVLTRLQRVPAARARALCAGQTRGDWAAPGSAVAIGQCAPRAPSARAGAAGRAVALGGATGLGGARLLLAAGRVAPGEAPECQSRRAQPPPTPRRTTFTAP